MGPHHPMFNGLPGRGNGRGRYHEPSKNSPITIAIIEVLLLLLCVDLDLDLIHLDQGQDWEASKCFLHYRKPIRVLTNA